MQRRDLRVDEVTAAECPGNCSETVNLLIEFDRQTIALAEIAIEVSYRARSPSSGFAWAAAMIHEWHRAHKHPIRGAEDSATRLIGQAKTSDNLSQ
jgi:hypothetical protein